MPRISRPQRPPRHSVWKSDKELTTGCAPVAPLVQHPLTGLRHITNPKTAQNQLGLSNRDLGVALARVLKLPRPLHKSSIAHYRNGRRAPVNVYVGYLRLLDEAIQQVNRAWSVKTDGEWRFAVFTHCATPGCGREFRVRRPGHRFCPECQR